MRNLKFPLTYIIMQKVEFTARCIIDRVYWSSCRVNIWEGPINAENTWDKSVRSMVFPRIIMTSEVTTNKFSDQQIYFQKILYWRRNFFFKRMCMSHPQHCWMYLSLAEPFGAHNILLRLNQMARSPYTHASFNCYLEAGLFPPGSVVAENKHTFYSRWMQLTTVTKEEPDKCQLQSCSLRTM